MIFNFYSIWLAIISIGLIKLAILIRNLFNHWKNKNIPYIPLQLPNTSLFIGEVHQQYYKWAKKNNYKHLGTYSLWMPTYMPIDPSLVKVILATGFANFADRGLYTNTEIEPVASHLISLDVVKWKRLRGKLTPAFSSGKVKLMCQTVIEVGNNLKNVLDEICTSDDPVDVYDISKSFSMDVVGSCAFGLDCNSFKDPNNEFKRYGKRFVDQFLSVILKCNLYYCYPNLAKLFRLRTMTKDVSDFYLNVTKQTIKYRKENSVKRNDFLQILIDLQNDSNNMNISDNDVALTVEEIAAQCFLFFIAGYETSASTITFCLYELAKNLEIQDKVRSEIYTVLGNHDGQITYNSLMEMKYTGQVIDETLRKYPIIPFLNRCCVEDFKIPNTDIVIDKGTMVYVPVYPLHHDPDYYPDPEKFDPERFSDQNKSKIAPFTYIPFGDGPRSCMGIRFGLLEVKVALVSALNNFSFTVNEKTNQPLKMDPRMFSCAAVNGIWLNAVKILN